MANWLSQILLARKDEGLSVIKTKKYILFTAFGLILGVLLGVMFGNYYNSLGAVIITNHTLNPLTDVAVMYNGDKDKVAWIGTVLPKDSFTVPINYANIHEGSLSVVYTLKGEIMHTAAFGYVAEYNKERYKVDIR